MRKAFRRLLTDKISFTNNFGNLRSLNFFQNKKIKRLQKIIMCLPASETKSAFFGVGRRKTSVAKIMLVPGTGSMVINQKQGELYLQFNSQYINASKNPLTTLGLDKMYDIYVNTHGGGLKGQADAIKLGVARALCYMSPENRAPLKTEGLLTRDSRRKERKKYGLRKARKAPQYSKR